MKWVTAMVAHPGGHEHGDAHEGEDHEDMHGHEGHAEEKPAHATFSDVLPHPVVQQRGAQSSRSCGIRLCRRPTPVAKATCR